MMHGDKQQNIIDECKEKEIFKVKVAVSDIDGILRGKYIHRDKLESALEKGLGFCSVVFGWDSADLCYTNSSYTGWHSGYPDALVKLDPSTLRYTPWDAHIPFLLGSFYEHDGKTPLAVCPRSLLTRLFNKAQEMGFQAMQGCEFEWFNFRETAQSWQEKGYIKPTPLTPGMFGYSLLRSALHRDFFHEMLDALRQFRVPLEGLHTETGPGVYEAAIQCCLGIEAADRAVLFKTAIKELAAKHGIMPSFMARWTRELPGCGGHIHQSLCDDKGRNLFFDPKARHGMSSLFESYLAGLIRYTPEFLLMMAPTVNSYKRLVPGYWAPTSPSWGFDNRTVAFRVIVAGPSATRVEVRVPGADVNPYLAIAASLGAGLLGIEQKLELSQPPVRTNGYEDRTIQQFPSNLQAAVAAFSASEAACELFGEVFVNHFKATRQWEWEQSQTAVTDWELKRYFEII